MIDIYFNKNYAKIHENIENGEAEYFVVENSYGKITHNFIKREIPIKIDGNIYYDIITPYGYGGPNVEVFSNSIEEKENLIKLFETSFTNYCKENKIISEFVRFHPMFGNHVGFEKYYNVEYLRPVVATKISKNKNTFDLEFSKSTKKLIRKLLKNDIEIRITEKPSDVSSFIEVYYSTMDRNSANDFYYFEKEYFDNFLEKFREKIILIEIVYLNDVIGSAFYFTSNSIVYAHLSGTRSEYLHLSPAYLIKYATVKWAEENGKEFVFYGGGTSSSLDDSLLNFKKNFSKQNLLKYYIGKKIYNHEVYELLCRKKDIVHNDNNFFPLYRLTE